MAVLVVWEYEWMVQAPAVLLAANLDLDLDLDQDLNQDLEEPEVGHQEEVGAEGLVVAVLLQKGLTMATMEVGVGGSGPTEEDEELLQPDRKFIPF